MCIRDRDRDVPDLVLATELNNRLWGVEEGSQELLASRSPRGRVRKLTKINGMLGGAQLCFVDGTDFFYEGACYGQVTDGEKLLVRMGGKILIFPDKLAFDTETYSFSSVSYTHLAGGADPAGVQKRQERPGAAHCGQRAVVEAAPLAADEPP